MTQTIHASLPTPAQRDTNNVLRHLQNDLLCVARDCQTELTRLNHATAQTGILTQTADGLHRYTTDFTSARAACIAAARANVALVGASDIDPESVSDPDELTFTTPPAVTS